ncbi:MAG TPA: hypothetical protein VGT03_10515, partial [Candidatus Acidoferrales bacterium]|nr:hypothetical protein [Candidatus Acidoferrales bacterium]
WSGWIWAFFPYSIYFTNDRIWDTWLATLLLCVIFLIVLRLQRSASPALWVWYGLLWGVVGLTDASVLSLLLPLGIWVCYRRHKSRLKWFAPNAAAALIFFAVVSPWFVRNYRVFHEFIPFRDCLGLELHEGNNGDTSHWFPRMAGPWNNDTEWKEYVQRGELAYMADKKRQALTYIERHPAWYVWVSLRRVVFLWTGYWSFNRRYLAVENMDPYNIVFSTSLTFLALAGLWFAFRDRGWAVDMPYLLVLFFFPLVYYLAVVEDWYRRPIDPFFVVLAAYAITSRLRPSPPETREPSHSDGRQSR